MGAPVSSIDATSRRWLAVLALAFLASAAFLAHSFIKALSFPGEDGVAAQQPARESIAEAPTRSEPVWIHPQEALAVDDRQTPTSIFSTDNKDKMVHKKDEVAAREVVHSQAEYLRALVKQNKLPDAYGHLTLEQIDEMEKKGVLIE